MSSNRDDCEHGHGRQVHQLAEEIGALHDIDVKSSILVCIDHDGVPFVIGRYNTAALATAADAVLEQAAGHTPDGCTLCDTAAKACASAMEHLRTEFHERQRRRGLQ